MTGMKCRCFEVKNRSPNIKVLSDHGRGIVPWSSRPNLFRFVLNYTRTDPARLRHSGGITFKMRKKVEVAKK